MKPAPTLRRVAVRCALSAALVFAVPAFAEDPPTNEELFEMYKQQQEQINATADAVESGNDAGGGWFEKTSLGGYGELHFNWLEGSDGAENKSQADFHRFVLFINHEFSDKIHFYSEVELEHALAGDDKPGEVELEQAFLQFDIAENKTLNTGLFLVPVGILNETHEPPTFYGVERNPIENKIIPSTWWEAGASLNKRFDHGISADLAVHTGLQTDDTFSIRGGRQKVAEAVANDVAITGRLVYRGLPGLEVAATVQWHEDVASEPVENTDAILFETHIVYTRGPFGLRALYARWDLDSDAAEDIGADEQYGFYVEPSFKLCEEAGVFYRYNQFNTNAGNSGGTMRQHDVGVNYWPHPQVVFKVDGQFQANDNGSPELDGVNVGMGFNF